MTATLRLLTCFALVSGLVAVGGRCLAPRLLADLGLDWQEMAELHRRQEREQARAAALKRTSDAMTRRIAGKTAVVDRLIAGELSLPQAAAAFKRLHDENAGVGDDLRTAFPAASEGESLCLQVIVWVEAELRYRGADLALATRLRAELHDIVRRDGTVTLPPA